MGDQTDNPNGGEKPKMIASNGEQSARDIPSIPPDTAIETTGLVHFLPLPAPVRNALIGDDDRDTTDVRLIPWAVEGAPAPPKVARDLEAIRGRQASSESPTDATDDSSENDSPSSQDDDNIWESRDTEVSDVWQKFGSRSPEDTIVSSTISGEISRTLADIAGLPPVIVTDFSPRVGPTTGDTPIVLDGTGFRPGLSVQIGDFPVLDLQVLDSLTMVGRTSPCAQPKVYPLTVRAGTEVHVMFDYAFEYQRAPSPVVDQILPYSGPLAGDLEVTILGAHFCKRSAVELGGRLAPTRFVNSGCLRFQAPASAKKQRVDVIVRNPDGQSVVGSKAFSYTDDRT